MGDSNGSVTAPIRLRRYLGTLMVLWTVAVGATLVWPWDATLGWGLLWLIGLIGIVLGGRWLRGQVGHHRRAEAELKEVRDRLVRQTRLAAIGQVTAGIAHELRNPLGTVRNAAFFLRSKTPPDEPKWREYLDMIERETAAAGQIITDMMAMTQDKQPAKSWVPFRAIVTSARCGLIWPEAIRWRENYRPDPLMVDADAGLLEQVLRNLLANAIQALGPPSRTEAGSISIEASHGQPHDEIVISDDGPGIPAGHREQIFEPLFTTKSTGTGLGLTICRQIIEAHGGTLEAIDTDRGAAFRIRLPSRPDPS